MPQPFNLKDHIGNIVLSLTANVNDEEIPVAYRYLRKSEENVKGDYSAYPAIIFIEPDQGGWTNNQQGTIKRFTNCFFQFITTFEMAQDATVRDIAIEDMRKLAERFINRIINDEDFEVNVSDFNYITVIDKYDVNVVGIELNIPKLIYTQPTPC